MKKPILLPDSIVYEFTNITSEPQTVVMFGCNYNDKGQHDNKNVTTKSSFTYNNLNKVTDRIAQENVGVFKGDIKYLAKDCIFLVWGVEIIVSERPQFVNRFYTINDFKSGECERILIQPLNYMSVNQQETDRIYIPLNDVGLKCWNKEYWIKKETYIETIINSFCKVTYTFCLNNQVHESLKLRYHGTVNPL